MGIDSRWHSPKWKEFLDHVDRLQVYAPQQGDEQSGPQPETDATALLRAVPALLKETLRIEEEIRSGHVRALDPVGVLQETAKEAQRVREEVQRLRLEVAALAALVPNAPKA